MRVVFPEPSVAITKPGTMNCCSGAVTTFIGCNKLIWPGEAKGCVLVSVADVGCCCCGDG